MKRAGNNPKRRVAPSGFLSVDAAEALAASVKYVASGHHKRNPADYGLERTNPRPAKSLCDWRRTITLLEAACFLLTGIRQGLVSEYAYGRFPKFVWFVGNDGLVYEAKTDGVTPGCYHGYPVEDDDDTRRYIESVWKQRCLEAGR